MNECGKLVICLLYLTHFFTKWLLQCYMKLVICILLYLTSSYAVGLAIWFKIISLVHVHEKYDTYCCMDQTLPIFSIQRLLWVIRLHFVVQWLHFLNIFWGIYYSATFEVSHFISLTCVWLLLQLGLHLFVEIKLVMNSV